MARHKWAGLLGLAVLRSPALAPVLAARHLWVGVPMWQPRFVAFLSVNWEVFAALMLGATL